MGGPAAARRDIVALTGLLPDSHVDCFADALPHDRLSFMPTWKLTIEYKGTRYQGWQEQAEGRTVQGEIRKAAEDYFGEKVDLGGSGRTDAGVHALAQVAHLRATRKRPSAEIQWELNERLPYDIHILNIDPRPERFHARHSALARCYLYQISVRRTAFAKDFVWWVKAPVNLNTIQNCAELFEGRHDFWSFTERPLEQGSTIVVVEKVQVAREGDLILIRLVASHFLWKMVRRLVGTLAQVGTGKLEPDKVKKLIKSRSAETGPWTAPSAGLFLEQVLYPGDSVANLIRPGIPVG
jgi:tRNA pseudouridine38-40 synthase